MFHKVKRNFFIFSCIAIPLIIGFGIWKHFSSQAYYFEIPVKFNSANQPCINIEIDGKEYCVLADLGSKLELSLRDDILEPIIKKPADSVNWRDVHGNKYEADAFTLPKIRLGNHIYTNVIANFENFECSTKGSRAKNGEEISEERLAKSWKRKDGNIGRPLLVKLNLLLDLGHSTIIACDSLDGLKNRYDLSLLSEVPFTKHKDGSICFKIETDIGFFNFVLDTGGVLTVVKKYLVNAPCDQYFYGLPDLASRKFIIGGIDLGPKNFVLYDLSPLMEEDGILGVDFLSDHIVYLDFKKNIAYIAKNACDCGKKRFYETFYYNN